MAKTISATEAQSHFDDLLRDVADHGETVFVERSGGPTLVVLSVAEYERLRTENNRPESDLSKWLEEADAVREAIASSRNGRPLPDVSELIHQMREERDAQALANLHRR